MKKSYSILFLSLLSFYSCSFFSKKEDDVKNHFSDNQLSFFNPCEIIYAEGKLQGYTYEKWLRNPSNLIVVHETLKKVGYEKLFSDIDLKSNPTLIWGYVSRPLDTLIDSLIITYQQEPIKSKYYREFWQRRKKEKNSTIVFEILQEISKIIIQKESIKYNQSLVNDTLYNLVNIEYLRKNPSKKQAVSDFKYLKSIGMHGSAYNLLFEKYNYYNVKWNKHNLVNELTKDSLRRCYNTWVVDDTK